MLKIIHILYFLHRILEVKLLYNVAFVFWKYNNVGSWKTDEDSFTEHQVLQTFIFNRNRHKWRLRFIFIKPVYQKTP